MQIIGAIVPEDAVEALSDSAVVLVIVIVVCKIQYTYSSRCTLWYVVCHARIFTVYGGLCSLWDGYVGGNIYGPLLAPHRVFKI